MEEKNIEYTFILPCLNEEKTLKYCIEEIKQSIQKHNLNAEILVSDNGSTDNSVKIAKENGADYLGIGAMFSTSTKDDAKEVSFETLRQITEKVNLPFVLIGGITLDNVDKLKQFNPDGYALVSGILAVDDIGKRVGDWLNKI